MKPMSSIRSASSSIRISIRDKSSALLQMIEQPPGCRDDDIHSARQRMDLRLRADTAENQRAT